MAEQLPPNREVAVGGDVDAVTFADGMPTTTRF
jgi:hypothetical protein